MRKQGSYLAFLLNQQLYQRWYAKLICVLICVFESLRLVPGHLSVCCPTVAWQGPPGTAMVLINELMGGQGGGSPHGLGDCSPTTQGLSAPVGEAHCLCRGNRGQQPPTNQCHSPSCLRQLFSLPGDQFMEGTNSVLAERCESLPH